MPQTLRESSQTLAAGSAAARRFTIADGTVLVAATAVGCALIHAAVPGMKPREVVAALGQLVAGGMPLPEVAGAILELTAVLVVPCLAAWTLALAVLGVRRLRPRRRRLSRRPGVMACLVAALALVPVTVPALLWALCASRSPNVGLWALFASRSPNVGREAVFALCAVFGSVQAGAAILACWATMALAGRWRPEPTWIDRLGRLLGVAWLALAPLQLGLVVFWPF